VHRDDPRSPIWGGATLGLVIGLIVGLISGDIVKFVLLGVAIGAASGAASIPLAWLGQYLQRRRRGPDDRELILKALRKQGLSLEEAEFELAEREKAAEAILKSGEGLQPFEEARKILFAPEPLYLRRD
jgi:hypothetical protein